MCFSKEHVFPLLLGTLDSKSFIKAKGYFEILFTVGDPERSMGKGMANTASFAGPTPEKVGIRPMSLYLQVPT